MSSSFLMILNCDSDTLITATAKKKTKIQEVEIQAALYTPIKKKKKVQFKENVTLKEVLKSPVS